MDMAIVLHDGLTRTYPTSICQSAPQGYVLFASYYPTWGTRRVFRPFVSLQVGSDKMALSRLTLPALTRVLARRVTQTVEQLVKRSSFMNIALWVMQVLLAWIYGSAAFRKLFQLEKVRANQEWARQSSNGYIRFVAVSQLLGVLGMLLPIPTGIFPWLTPLAAIGFCIIQVLAAGWHIRLKEYKVLPVNLFLFALSLFVAVGRWQLFSVL
jgi:hypothetical protein